MHVGYLEMPQPHVFPRVEPKGEAMVHTARFAIPHEAIRSSAEPDFRTRTEHLSDERFRSGGAQVDARNAAVDG